MDGEKVYWGDTVKLQDSRIARTLRIKHWTKDPKMDKGTMEGKRQRTGEHVRDYWAPQEGDICAEWQDITLGGESSPEMTLQSFLCLLSHIKDFIQSVGNH